MVLSVREEVSLEAIHAIASLVDKQFGFGIDWFVLNTCAEIPKRIVLLKCNAPRVCSRVA